MGIRSLPSKKVVILGEHVWPSNYVLVLAFNQQQMIRLTLALANSFTGCGFLAFITFSNIRSTYFILFYFFLQKIAL